MPVVTSIANTPVIDEAIRHMLIVEGRTWAYVSDYYGISCKDARDAFDRAESAIQARRGSAAEAWRDSILHVCLDVASQSQQAFERSQKRKVKRIKKDTPNGIITEVITETSVGDPRFLNTRLAAAQTIAQIQIPKLPQEINVNSRSQHDITVKLESMSDADLEKLAMIAQMEQDGILVIDSSDVRRIEDKKDAEQPEIFDSADVAQLAEEPDPGS